jgi:hypothetical protein
MVRFSWVINSNIARESDDTLVATLAIFVHLGRLT